MAVVGITSHTPDLGYGGWEHNRPNDTSIGIDSTEDWVKLTDTVPTMVRSTSDVRNDHFAIECKVKVDSVAGGTNQQFGINIWRRGDSTIQANPSNFESEGLFVFYRDSGTEQSSGVEIHSLEYYIFNDTTKAISSSGILATVASEDILFIGRGFAWPGRYLRLEVDYPNVVVKDREGNESEFTTRGTIVMTTDLRDSDHLRQGFSGRRGASASSGWFMHELRTYE
jgi:hypothetical protein